MGNYYFLAASLPPLVLGQKPEINFEELKNRLEINLSKRDLARVRTLLLFTDLQNIRALLSEEPIDPRGNLDEKELDEALLIRNILPDYVFDFFDQFENLNERVKNFFGLLSRFFAEEIPQQTGFLQRYLKFEREWRLVMLALRAKELQRDLTRELQFEDLSDMLVAQILAQKDAPNYEPPPEWQELKELMISSGKDPWQRYKAFTSWRFKKIEEMVQRPLFSIDWILGYITQLMLVEHWIELDSNKGKMILESLKTG